MTRNERKYHAAAILLFLSAALHLPVLALAPQSYAPQAFVATVLWAAFGFGLLHGFRWVAYLAFLGMLAGLVFALGAAMSAFGLISVLCWLIFVVDLVAALALFGLLWSRPAVQPEV